MNKTLNFSDKFAVSFRKIIGIASMVFSVFGILLVVFGIIPVYQRKATPIIMVKNLFEIIKIGSKPLLYRVFHFGFSLLYFALLALLVRDLVMMIKYSGVWFKEEHDTKRARASVLKCVEFQNHIFIKVIILSVASYLLDPFGLGMWAKIIFIVLTFVNFALNFGKWLLVKRKILNCLLPTLSSTLILICTMLFMFNSEIKLETLIRSSVNFVRMILSFGKTLSNEFIVQVFLTNIVLPAFYIYVLVRLMIFFVISTSYGSGFYRFERNCKNFMITNMIALGIILIVEIIIRNDHTSLPILPLLVNKWEFALLSVVVFLLSKNHELGCVDAPSYDDLIQEKTKSPNDAVETNN